MNILFVCTGNTCRSPMAEALLREKATFVTVQSAGIFAHPGDSANKKTVEVLKEREITLSHTAQMVTEGLLKWSDLVLTMTDAHKQVLIDQYPAHQQKVFTLKQYVFNVKDDGIKSDITDPFGGDIHIYRKTLIEIESSIDKLLVIVQKD